MSAREYRLTCHVPATEIDPPEDYAYPWRRSRQRAAADARTDGPNRNPRRIREIESRPVPVSGRDGATVADGQSGPAPLNHDRLDPS
jgi:hypothetical protein